MAKYDPLEKFLASQSSTEVPMSFAELERILENPLPPSATHHRPWWANESKGHAHAKAWLNAGYRTTQVDMAAKRLVFKRIAPTAKAGGMSEAAREFKPADINTEKKPRRSPLFGALKGTFTIEPGWDVTKPAMDPDELAEMFANIERTADLIEAGLTRKAR